MADSFSANHRLFIQIFFLPLLGLVNTIWVGDCHGQVYYPATPKYYPYTIARAEDRTWIRNLPMERRPDRPLHFYGNMVRRAYSVQRPTYSVPATPIQTAPIQITPAIGLQSRP